MSSIISVFPGGRHLQAVTSVTLVNNTAKTIDTTVPDGKRWLLLNVRMNNPDDVARTERIWIYKEAAKTNFLRELLDSSINASAGGSFPSNEMSDVVDMQARGLPPIILSAGNTIQAYWGAGGASSGGTDADGLVVEYLELSV